MGLTRAELARLIPHSGDMCLLEEVLAWDDERILCRAVGHRSETNPLRSRGRLHALCGVEYAAQAMAIHGALHASDSGPTRGFLGSLRGVELGVRRLDDIEADLLVEAVRLMGDATSMMYEFRVAAGDMLALQGRAAVFLVPD